ncbi:hypothetical protein [Brucella pseudogrignonensis]|uniref:hypothetical protein n=1 Tax=Brucella pseudogrignonensis TaxID=419475 RepID=UPI000CFB846F|nr:hypothetical protein [Brucella pseudogrignonensis]MQP42360.1 hypothetical protein [Ochrobactrum sp. MYb237]PQZ44058.1 hypothetical protein CQ059_09320 [Brucella pseudogrignonensis]PRA38302.1 hypothetical protein CQ063_19185 [Brucella pseudogrignonensis]PRA64145.1 hypothetical protein CQ055_19075 [Brucella pseudogrignonensis]
MTNNTANIPILSVVPRTSNGQFASGNPGRPIGAKGKKSREALEKVKSFGPLAIEQLKIQVVNGERWAVEYVLSKILPTGRTIEFEEMEVEDVKHAMKYGDISVAEAKEITASLAKLAEIADVQELRAKLEKLEAILNA